MLTFDGPKEPDSIVRYKVTDNQNALIGEVYKDNSGPWMFAILPTRYGKSIKVSDLREIAQWCQHMDDYQEAP